MKKNVIEVTLERAEIPVILTEEDGTKVHLVMRELTGKQRDTYMNTLGDKLRFNDKGKPIGLKSFDGIQTGLLAECLYEDEGHRYSAKKIDKMPARAREQLFDACQELNGLTEGSEEELGND